MSVENTLIPNAVKVISRRFQLKTKGKGRREKRRFVAIRSSPPSVQSSLPALVAVRRRSATVCHLRMCVICVVELKFEGFRGSWLNSNLNGVMVPFKFEGAIMSSSYPRNNFTETDAMFRGIPDAASCVGIRSVRRGTPDATLADPCHGVGRGIPNAVLVRRRECLSRLISPDVIFDVVKNVSISFSDVFSLSPTFLCVGSTPISC
uniref:Uncharacterized protein n=1 Tax=Cucumis melo TaxID=3656 RepID=A0A9I9EA57_CUCME